MLTKVKRLLGQDLSNCNQLPTFREMSYIRFHHLQNIYRTFLGMEAASFSKTSVTIYHSTRRHTSKDFNLYLKSCEDMRSRIKMKYSQNFLAMREYYLWRQLLKHSNFSASHFETQTTQPASTTVTNAALYYSINKKGRNAPKLIRSHYMIRHVVIFSSQQQV